jgi:hypothetical protein
MRARTLLAVGLIALPVLAGAQRRTPRGGQIPTSVRPIPPAELPQQPRVVGQSVAYQRSKVSMETYPFMSWVQAPGFAQSGTVARWSNFSVGQRMAYQINQRFQGTLDVTQSIALGYSQITTAELGTRIQTERTDTRARPYVDFRFGYVMSSAGYNTYNGFAPPSSGIRSPGQGYSSGFGGIAGTGVEVAISRMVSLTTGVSAIHSRVQGHGSAFASADGKYWTMNAIRLQAGLRFNPVRRVNLESRNTVTQH